MDDPTGKTRCKFSHDVVGASYGNGSRTIFLRPCFDFLNKGVCPFGERCRYQHQESSNPSDQHHTAFMQAKSWAYAKNTEDQKREEIESAKRRAQAAPTVSTAPIGTVAAAQRNLPPCLVAKVAGVTAPPASAAASTATTAPAAPHNAGSLLGLAAYGSGEDSSDEDGEADSGAADGGDGEEDVAGGGRGAEPSGLRS